MLLLPALIFLSVSLGLIGLCLWLAPNRARQRVQALSATERKSDWVETAVSVIGPFARLSAPEADWDASPLKRAFLTAGIRHPQAQLIYFGLKTVLPAVYAALAFASLRAATSMEGLTLTALVTGAALAGCYLPNFMLWWWMKSRRREIFENFPDAADLMLVSVEAGLGLDAALSKVAEEIRMKSLALAEELHLTNLELRAGATREQSLHNLAQRTGIEEVSTFATMLTQADKFGTSVGDSLRVFADDLRHKRHTRAEEIAAKIPTKMLLPLVICIFPAIIMVIMGPAAIRVVRIILPMINHGG